MILYECKICGWKGAESEMNFDCFPEDKFVIVVCCDYVCPDCGSWHNLEDYSIVELDK